MFLSELSLASACPCKMKLYHDLVRSAKARDNVIWQGEEIIILNFKPELIWAKFQI